MRKHFVQRDKRYWNDIKTEVENMTTPWKKQKQITNDIQQHKYHRKQKTYQHEPPQKSGLVSGKKFETPNRFLTVFSRIIDNH